jgi:hypothetical protein
MFSARRATGATLHEALPSESGLVVMPAVRGATHVSAGTVDHEVAGCRGRVADPGAVGSSDDD